MIALQRSAGNASALALLRRAGDAGLQAPITLTLPGVVDSAVVSSWHMHGDSRQQITDVELTRPTDSDSPRLAKAYIEGARGVTATLLVRKRTPLGWIRDRTVTLNDCWIASFSSQGELDSVWLRFTRMEVEQ